MELLPFMQFWIGNLTQLTEDQKCSIRENLHLVKMTRYTVYI